MDNKTEKYLASWGSDRRLPPDERDAKNLGSAIDLGFDVSENQLSWIGGMTLIDAAFNQLLKQSEKVAQPLFTEIAVLPKEIANSLGKPTVTVSEYLEELGRLGVDISDLKLEALEREKAYRASQAESEDKAQRLFDMILDSPFFTDEQVHALVDSTSIYKFVHLVLENVTTARARINARTKLAADPKQIEKALVKECWDAWQHQKNNYKTNAAFARDMLDKFEKLTSQPVIERWCREWKSQLTTKPAK